MIHGSDIKNKLRGFTLIELMLAMTFVSVLLLAIAMTVIQVGNIYSKGMALKDINQSSRMLSDDIRRTVASAGNISVSPENYIVHLVDGSPVSGRLCLGNYSYLWNTVDAKEEMTEAMRLSADGNELISAVKVPDSSGVYCARNSTGGMVVANAVRVEDAHRMTELLVQGDHSLSLTAFSIQTTDLAYNSSTGQRLFTIDYSIGTGQPGAMTESRTGCLAPGEENADPTYCNVQQFTMVVRSGGGE